MKERFETFTVLVNRINRNIRRIKNQEMVEYDLRSIHVSCLYYLFTEQGFTATDLCEKCEEDKATISRAIDYLEKSGFVTCKAKHIKRYKSPLVLTEKGSLAGKQIAEKIDGVLNGIGEALTEEDRNALYRSLSIISEQLEVFCKNGVK